MNTTPEAHLQALLNSAKCGDLKIESLDIVSHADNCSTCTTENRMRPNGWHTITIEVQEKTL